WRHEPVEAARLEVSIKACQRRRRVAPGGAFPQVTEQGGTMTASPRLHIPRAHAGTRSPVPTSLAASSRAQLGSRPRSPHREAQRRSPGRVAQPGSGKAPRGSPEPGYGTRRPPALPWAGGNRSCRIRTGSTKGSLFRSTSKFELHKALDVASK